jgi:hypothetical protein
MAAAPSSARAQASPSLHYATYSTCSFRWFITAENTVRWFIMKEKYYWMAADLAE